MKHKTTKYGLLVLLLAAMSLMNCNAQHKHTAGIVVDKMNVFYAGISNPITIVSSVPHKKLHIDWGGAAATSLGEGRYDVEVPNTFVGREIIVHISAELKKGKIVDLGNHRFRVKAVPQPSVFVGGNMVSGEYPKEQILANPFISARFPSSFDYSLPLKIVSYRVAFLDDEDDPIIVNGAKFSDSVIEKIQNASSGTIIVFSDFQIQRIAGECDIEEAIVISIK
ncbi:MAG: hypothetical protein FWH36_02850 [Lentimicrobiaceae bacterium]|nr:hypothetical protein [Lentimicrobiaceae bacterium]